ncbi:hypothetical protein ACFL5Z_09570 [Planctomycetota bacterium]
MHWDFEEIWNDQDVNDASGNLNYGRIIDGLDGISAYTPLETGQGLNLFSDEAISAFSTAPPSIESRMV